MACGNRMDQVNIVNEGQLRGIATNQVQLALKQVRDVDHGARRRKGPHLVSIDRRAPTRTPERFRKQDVGLSVVRVLISDPRQKHGVRVKALELLDDSRDSPLALFGSPEATLVDTHPDRLREPSRR